MDRENEQRISLKCSLLCTQFEEKSVIFERIINSTSYGNTLFI